MGHRVQLLEWVWDAVQLFEELQHSRRGFEQVLTLLVVVAFQEHCREDHPAAVNYHFV